MKARTTVKEYVDASHAERMANPSYWERCFDRAMRYFPSREGWPEWCMRHDFPPAISITHWSIADLTRYANIRRADAAGGGGFVIAERMSELGPDASPAAR